ncbi:hypothetical protein QE250_16785, partial [Chromatiaceae bacterium AAb-1]|nr:hypothetical protein [Chromatiaceae bacterium AAb-1]
DPIIQNPGDSQSFNPYSYIMNNPLAGTDPTGYSIEIVIRCGGSNPACDGHIPAGPKDSAGGSESVGKSPESGLLVNNGASSAVQRLGQSSVDIGQLQNTNNQSQTLTSQQKHQIYSDTLSTIGSGAKAAIGNLIPDTVNGIAGWTEQFLHKGEGSLGRLDQWVGVENEIVQEVANDLRKVGAVATANIPLMRGASTARGPVVIGETMTRVETAASKIPNSKILNDMPDFRAMGQNPHQVTSSMMHYNRIWILEQMRSGRPILDIGKDPNRAAPSIFYQMEQSMLKNYQRQHPEWNSVLRQ